MTSYKPTSRYYLLDEWIGDLPLIAEVVASQLAKTTSERAGNTSRTGSNGNPHPPAPDARASAVTARAPAQVAVALFNRQVNE